MKRIKRISIKFRVLIASITIVFVLYSCYYDSKEYLYPQVDSSCDTTNVTFQSSIAPIMDQYCLSCHSNSTAASFGSNIKLEDYADVKSYADKGNLLGAIKQLPGFTPMPKGSGAIPNCNIRKLETWINNGSLND